MGVYRNIGHQGQAAVCCCEIPNLVWVSSWFQIAAKCTEACAQLLNVLNEGLC